MTHFDFEKPLVELEERIRALRAALGAEAEDAHIRELEIRAERLQREIYGHLEPWQKVQLSRHPARPYFLDYAGMLFEDFVELHGDRAFGDDAAIVAGFALASRFGRPIFTFIDTPGAYPGVGAEERGQSEAIGRSILEMSALEVPVIATVLGEGGSGGALALGVANRVLMFEFSTYSVITPEGCASILWRDGGMAPEAAEQLKLLSPDARRLNIVDEIIEEPLGGAHRAPERAAEALGEALLRHLVELEGMSRDELLRDRHAKFRAMGEFLE